MKINKKKLEKLIEQLDTIEKEAKSAEKKYKKQLDRVHPKDQNSAENLIHYLAFRHQNIQDLQRSLGKLGLSRLGRAESHVLASVTAVRNLLNLFLKSKKVNLAKATIAIKEGNKLIRSNTNALLGKKRKGSKARIMVTFPTEAGQDKKLVESLLTSGMNCTRINCAHDNPDIWQMMAKNVKRASRKTGRSCKICMDLGGPKLRTGLMEPGPKVIHIQPERDVLGNIMAPGTAWMTGDGAENQQDGQINIPLDNNWLSELKEGNEIRFRDARNKNRKFTVTNVGKNGVAVKCDDSAYIVTGTRLNLIDRNGRRISTEVGELIPVEQKINLKIGDTLTLHRTPENGEPARYDADGNVIQSAHISCTLPEVFNQIAVGDPILLDDGKIEGVVKSVTKEQVKVQISYAKEEGANLKGDKGINLPESNLRIRGLTAKDKEDLKSVVQIADVVNMSFVNTAGDVQDLIDALRKLKAEHIGIILKIETKSGFKNLPAILMAAMQWHPIGVMVARGDLAIEVGWKNLAYIQEEIMRLCEAAHVPIVWATQVLESMAKKGRPSRAEITDASMAQAAECVMLNKGPHITEAIKMLNDIMQSMEIYQDKKAPMIPTLKTTDYMQLYDL
jgi:pyruvate kinase